jgi:hypothetical protein
MIHPKVLKTLDEAVSLRVNVVRAQDKIGILYDMDAIIVVNTSCEDFTTAKYWQGRTGRHKCLVDLSHIKKFVFLFNFVVEPAARLPSILKRVGDVRIIAANTMDFHILSTADRFREIRHLPRMVLASPIDPDSVTTYKKPSQRIRIGQHSMPYMEKFNREISLLVARINNVYHGRVLWHFMGMPAPVAGLVAHHTNVLLHEPFAFTVREFLEETDIFLFYPVWERSEPWARSIAEALMSGTPVVATARGGTRDQIIQSNNGYLCNCLDDFVRYLSVMIERPEIVRLLGRNASLNSKYFTTEYITHKLIEYIR